MWKGVNIHRRAVIFEEWYLCSTKIHCNLTTIVLPAIFECKCSRYTNMHQSSEPLFTPHFQLLGLESNKKTWWSIRESFRVPNQMIGCRIIKSFMCLYLPNANIMFTLFKCCHVANWPVGKKCTPRVVPWDNGSWSESEITLRSSSFTVQFRLRDRRKRKKKE